MPRRTNKPPTRYVSRRTLLGAGAMGSGIVALSACGGDDNSGGGGDVPKVEYEQGSASLQAELGEEISGVLYPEGYVGPKAREITPFGDSSKTFRVLTRQETGMDLKTNAYSKYLEEKTGVKITYETVPMGDEGTPKINAMISSGDLPDAFMLGPQWMGGFTKSQLYAYGSQGLFQPLDQLIDEWAPEAVQMFQDFPRLRPSLTAPDGAMYTFPGANQCYHCKSMDNRAWINREWLEQIGATAPPATTDEVKEVLTEFKKAFPDGKPMSGWKDELPIIIFASAFLNPGRDWLRRAGEDIQFTPVLDEFREALVYVRSLVAEDLLDPNTFTQTSEQFQRLTMAEGGPKVGLARATSMGWLGELDLSNPDAPVSKYDALAPIAGPDGKAYASWKYDAGPQVGLVITNACEDPQALVRWADAQMNLVSTMTMRLGPQGEGWDWAKEGEKGIDDRQAIYGRIPNELENAGWGEWGPYNLCMDVRHGERVDDTGSQEPILYQASKDCEPFATPEEEFFEEPFFSVDQAAQIGEYTTNIQTALVQGFTDFSLGKTDITDDSAWDSFKQGLEGAGLTAYLDVMKEADQTRAG